MSEKKEASVLIIACIVCIVLIGLYLFAPSPRTGQYREESPISAIPQVNKPASIEAQKDRHTAHDKLTTPKPVDKSKIYELNTADERREQAEKKWREEYCSDVFNNYERIRSQTASTPPPELIEEYNRCKKLNQAGQV